MDKDKIIVSVVIDKQALVDRAFDISKNPSEFNEIEKVIDGKNQFTRDIDEIDDEGKKENNTNLFGRHRIGHQFSVRTRNWQSPSASIRLRTRRTLSSLR